MRECAPGTDRMHAELEGDLLIRTRSFPNGHGKLNGFEIHEVRRRLVGAQRLCCALTRTSDAEKAAKLYGKPSGAPVEHAVSPFARPYGQPLTIGEALPGGSPPTLADLERYAETIAGTGQPLTIGQVMPGGSPTSTEPGLSAKRERNWKKHCGQ